MRRGEPSVNMSGDMACHQTVRSGADYSQRWAWGNSPSATGARTFKSKENRNAMRAMISQIPYANRQAFFARVALSLPLQPAIRIGPAPLPGGTAQARISEYAKGGPDRNVEHGAKRHGRHAKHSLKPQIRCDDD